MCTKSAQEHSEAKGDGKNLPRDFVKHNTSTRRAFTMRIQPLHDIDARWGQKNLEAQFSSKDIIVRYAKKCKHLVSTFVIFSLYLSGGGGTSEELCNHL